LRPPKPTLAGVPGRYRLLRRTPTRSRRRRPPRPRPARRPRRSLHGRERPITRRPALREAPGRNAGRAAPRPPSESDAPARSARRNPTVGIGGSQRPRPPHRTRRYGAAPVTAAVRNPLRRRPGPGERALLRPALRP